ncbi:aldehyde dehydrogenase [Schizophyllum commune Loenen D]|nr:aldehyde dehydrogenase [Schizophyllum commune Loenen D]
MSSTALKHTDSGEIEKIHARLRATFDSGKTLPLAYRRQQLLQLARLVQDNTQAMQEAIYKDYRKQPLEVALGDTTPIVPAALRAAEKLEEWTKPEKPEVEEWRSSWDTTIYKVPKGVAVIISPWNFPYILSLGPLVGAIAAGCPAILKPSEHTPSVAALLAELVPKYLDSEAYAVVNGAVAETARLLELKFDHIFFTGSTNVGRIVAAAAAKQLTPTTLELGGKSPVFVDAENTDIEIAAKRVLWGRQINAGQVCVSPDYILVPRSHQDAFVVAIQKAYKQFYPDGALESSSTLTAVHPSAQERVKGLIARTKGEIVAGGKEKEGRIEPTVVKNVDVKDALMEGEIFAPIMSIVPVDNVDEAISIIRSYSTPLVIHVFTESAETKDKFLYGTRSGTLVLNDTFMELGVHETPFGGLGDSGFGSFSGKYGFDTFTHQRSYINVPLAAEPLLGHRYPPYTEEGYKFFAAGASQKIPDN